jgi:predicted phage terminase large subunit-like protein
MSFHTDTRTTGNLTAAEQRRLQALARAEIKLECEESLLSYFQYAWTSLVPTSPMRVSWPLEAIAEHLQAVSDGKIRNLLINVPPGFSKSLLTDVVWPSWEWGPRNRPDLQILSWSYAEKIVERNSVRCRTLIDAPFYKALWGDRFDIDPRQDSKLHFGNDHLGFKLSSTVAGTGTGLRGDRLIVDDPHNVESADSDAKRQNAVDWFAGTLTTRVNNANHTRERVGGRWADPTTTVVIMQRLHRKDVSGVIIDAGMLGFEHLLIEMDYEGTDHPARRTSGWRPSSIGYTDPREGMVQTVEQTRATFYQESGTRVSSDAAEKWWDAWLDTWGRIALSTVRLAFPQRYDRATVEADKIRLGLKQGTSAVAGQYRQWPTDGEGTLFKREWFKFVKLAELGARDDVRGWDLAATDSPTSDATASVKMRMDGRGRIYILDAKRVRLSPAQVEDHIRDTADRDGMNVFHSFPQDPGGAGVMVISAITRNVMQGKRFTSSREVKKKRDRAAPFAAQVEHKNVYLVEGPWNEELIQELTEFDAGEHDDLVDACSRAYDCLLKRPPTIAPVAPELFVEGKAVR